MNIVVKTLPNFGDLPLPSYETAGAAGMDLRSASTVQVYPNGRALIPTGLALQIPEGFEVQIRPRSGLAFKHGIFVLNSPGTIDSDYRGEIGVLLANFGNEVFVVKRGDRIAQMVVAPVVQANLVLDVNLTASERGVGGFGSTGVH